MERVNELEEQRNAEDLVASIRNTQSGSDNYVAIKLQADERVIARITDGIYRQPGSALRELIVNAYDADAQKVVIKTDAPRFGRISVEDNGHGMTPEAVVHLVLHIGGSAKRNEEGRILGITDPNNSMLSPNGRKLIGKIGIGLFSVSHLTNTFQIITKVKDDPYRTIATIVLKRYQDESGISNENGGHKYESGKVNIWREKASDTGAHGTSIVLNGIWPTSRDTLRSTNIWSIVDQDEILGEQDRQIQAIDIPKFNIGRVDDSKSGDEVLLKETESDHSSLPWNHEDSSTEAFRKLVEAVWNEIGQGTPNPQLKRIFDFYLHMIWDLSLSLPLPYFESHPFDIEPGRWAATFMISNKQRGKAEKLNLDIDKPIRGQLELTDTAINKDSFVVIFDALKLSRPLKFKDFPKISNHAITKPVMCIGKCREDFNDVPTEFSGGALEFEAYIFWHPKIAPTEHRGSLIRIHGASGTLFDPSFMRWQTAEHMRMGQITCEIFVHEGLDSALNIDRESFNHAHPHSIFITKWLHNALRQFASAHKNLGNEIRAHTRDERQSQTKSEIQKLAAEVWTREADDVGSEPPSITLVSKSDNLKNREITDAYVFNREDVIPSSGTRNAKRQSDQILEEKLKAIAQILASYGLLDSIPAKKQNSLLNAIYKILKTIERK